MFARAKISQTAKIKPSASADNSSLAATFSHCFKCKTVEPVDCVAGSGQRVGLQAEGVDKPGSERSVPSRFPSRSHRPLEAIMFSQCVDGIHWCFLPGEADRSSCLPKPSSGGLKVSVDPIGVVVVFVVIVTFTGWVDQSMIDLGIVRSTWGQGNRGGWQ